MKFLSDRLTGARNLKGLNQAELADAVGVSTRSVLNWEKGEFDPRGKTLRRLCEVLGVTADYLYGEEEGRYPANRPDHHTVYEGDDLRTKSHAHLDRWMDGCEPDQERLAWTYVELQRRFPVAEAAAPKLEGKGLTDDLKQTALAGRDIAEQLSRSENPKHPQSYKAASPSGNKPSPGSGAPKPKGGE